LIIKSPISHHKCVISPSVPA